MKQNQTHIQISNSPSGTDISVVSNTEGDINISISEPGNQGQIGQVIQAMAEKRIQEMNAEAEKTMALMTAMQQLADSMQGQNPMLAQSMQQEIQELEERNPPALEP